jgi:hypothetical protein
VAFAYLQRNGGAARSEERRHSRDTTVGAAPIPISCSHECGAIMQTESMYDGQITYDFNEFCKDYGHPTGRMFTFEVTHNAVTYVYADVIGTVRDGEVVFCLNGSDLVDTRKAH